jgi:hypothetical protein
MNTKILYIVWVILSLTACRDEVNECTPRGTYPYAVNDSLDRTFYHLGPLVNSGSRVGDFKNMIREKVNSVYYAEAGPPLSIPEHAPVRVKGRNTIPVLWLGSGLFLLLLLVLVISYWFLR